jgi:hypothetical protein
LSGHISASASPPPVPFSSVAKEGLPKASASAPSRGVGIIEETDARGRRVRGARYIPVADGQLIEDLDGKMLRDLLLREAASR